jgi:hypothetical protein
MIQSIVLDIQVIITNPVFFKNVTEYNTLFISDQIING